MPRFHVRPTGAVAEIITQSVRRVSISSRAPIMFVYSLVNTRQLFR